MALSGNNLLVDKFSVFCYIYNVLVRGVRAHATLVRHDNTDALWDATGAAIALEHRSWLSATPVSPTVGVGASRSIGQARILRTCLFFCNNFLRTY